MVAITATLMSFLRMIGPCVTKTENRKPHEPFPKGKEKLFCPQDLQNPDVLVGFNC